MKVAIIGGGSAGIVCAHLLCRKHEVTLYEKAPILGGNIRTLNGNVSTSKVPKNITLDTGVTAFNYASSPTIRKLFKQLQVPFYLSAPKQASSILLKNTEKHTIPSFYTLKQYGLINFIKESKINIQLIPDIVKIF